MICKSCWNTVDPEVCHCGTETKKHNAYLDGHTPVPMGCSCGYAKRSYWTPHSEDRKLIDLIAEMSKECLKNRGTENRKVFIDNLRIVADELDGLQIDEEVEKLEMEK